MTTRNLQVEEAIAYWQSIRTDIKYSYKYFIVRINGKYRGDFDQYGVRLN